MSGDPDNVETTAELRENKSAGERRPEGKRSQDYVPSKALQLTQRWIHTQWSLTPTMARIH
ncbi:MAG: hypothetical protein GY696_33095 [Gammaproteobacteria bacterium]|nr:hypothetical protein [Gammaproteobacteria bacterium]